MDAVVQAPRFFRTEETYAEDALLIWYTLARQTARTHSVRRVKGSRGVYNVAAETTRVNVLCTPSVLHDPTPLYTSSYVSASARHSSSVSAHHRTHGIRRTCTSSVHTLLSPRTNSLPWPLTVSVLLFLVVRTGRSSCC